MGFDAAGLEHFFEASGVFFDIGCVVGNVGNGEEFAQFAHDAVFVCETVGVYFFDYVLNGWEGTLCLYVAANR